MKSRYIISIAALGALSSCGSMNDALYYNDGTKKEPKLKEAAVLPAEVEATQVAAPTPQKKARGLSSAGPFMQPDVFSMPDENALKETATSTQNNNNSPGLTVPQR